MALNTTFYCKNNVITSNQLGDGTVISFCFKKLLISCLANQTSVILLRGEAFNLVRGRTACGAEQSTTKSICFQFLYFQNAMRF